MKVTVLEGIYNLIQVPINVYDIPSYIYFSILLLRCVFISSIKILKCNKI